MALQRNFVQLHFEKQGFPFDEYYNLLRKSDGLFHFTELLKRIYSKTAIRKEEGNSLILSVNRKNLNEIQLIWQKGSGGKVKEIVLKSDWISLRIFKKIKENPSNKDDIEYIIESADNSFTIDIFHDAFDWHGKIYFAPTVHEELQNHIQSLIDSSFNFELEN